MRAATCVLVVMDAGTRLASNSVPDLGGDAGDHSGHFALGALELGVLVWGDLSTPSSDGVEEA